MKRISVLLFVSAALVSCKPASKHMTIDDVIIGYHTPDLAVRILQSPKTWEKIHTYQASTERKLELIQCNERAASYVAKGYDLAKALATWSDQCKKEFFFAECDGMEVPYKQKNEYNKCLDSRNDLWKQQLKTALTRAHAEDMQDKSIRSNRSIACDVTGKGCPSLLDIIMSHQ